MATAGDGKAPYESGGAGGKFRKRPFRRNVPAKPYDRPPIPLRSNNPSLLRKLVDPASRLIYAGAHRLFGAFRKRLPSLSLQGPPEVNVESQNVLQETGQTGNSANISAATGISELEQMLQQKSFTSSEIQRLTALLHSRTTELPFDVDQRDEAKPYNSASTSGSQKNHENERDNRFASFSSPIVSSKVFEEDIASPAELAKAYMGYRPTPTKLSPSPLRQDYKPINNTMGPPKTPITSTGPKTADSFTGQVNGLVTPRSRGRSAMYNMPRTPYARSPSTFTQKLIRSSYGHDAALTSSQSGFGHDEKTALKRRSSVLDDDIRSGGPLRRTRQKANLLSQRERRELGYPLQQPEAANQKLLLTNGPETNVLKRAEENGETSIHGSGSGYASIPTKSTQTATKILQHLEQLSPKEKESNKLTSLEKVDSPKLLNYLCDIQKPDVISKGKEKIEENGFEKFSCPRNMLTSVNGESSVTMRDNPPIVNITNPPLKVQGEPPQKKRAFQMSVADDSFEIEDDEIYVNNKPETTLLTNKPVADIIKVPNVPEASGTPALVENNKPVFPEVVKSPKQPPELKEAENTKSLLKTDGGSVSDQGLGFKLPNSSSLTITIQANVIPQFNLQTENVDLKRDSSSLSVGKIGENVSPFSFSANEIKPNAGTDPKAVESTSVFTKNENDSISIKNENGNDQKTAKIFGKPDHAKDSVFNKNENGNDQKTTHVFGKSPAATSASGSFMFGTPTNNSTASNVTPVTTAPTFPSFTSFPASTAASTTTTAASSVFSTSVQPPPVFSFGSANTTSALTAASVKENAKTDITSEKEPKFTITTSPFAITSFATTTTTAAATGSSLLGFSSQAATSSTTSATRSNPFGFSSPAATSTTTAATGSSPFGVSSPAATSTTTAATGSSVFGFSSLAATSTATAAVGSSPFGFSSPATTSTTTATTGINPFGFSSPAASSTTTAATGSSPFGFSSPAATSTATAATGSSPFGFSSPATTSTTTAATGSSPFSFSSPATTSTTSNNQSQGSFLNITNGSQATTTQTAPFQFGSTEGKSGIFTSGPTTSVFGSTWQAPQSSGFGSTFSSTPSSVFSFGASSTPTPSAGFFPTAGATNSPFATPSQSQPIFGKSTPVFGAISPNNNDRMSIEDSMAEDSMQTPGPVSPFGQTQTPVAAPGFMFGSANLAQTQPPVGFQFVGQPSQPPPQNPFQSSSVEFNGGGSFSLGSGGDKSGRRFVKVKKQTRRK